MEVVHLQGRHATLVLGVGDGVPTVLHWGASIDSGSLLDGAHRRPVAPGGFHLEAPRSLVPEHCRGVAGRPGLLGHRRGGSAWAPRFEQVGIEHTGQTVDVQLADHIAELALHVQVALDEVLTISASLTNTGDTRYLLDALSITVPMPAHASELLTFDGRWSREMQPRRRQFDTGMFCIENWAGRTSAEHQPTMFAGTAGFGEWHGEVWGLHLAWSANHVETAEHLADGRRSVQLGELLHPGELCLEPGDTYRTPTVVGCWSDRGLTAATQQFHRYLRGRARHPRRERPVLINTWEAVYFDHDLHRLKALADAAADVGVERFVLDDGWFGGRRSDRSSLGDWWVSHSVYPEGLKPLIGHVRSLGMEFGLWVEPEMVNPDSDLFRAHPEWALTTDGYQPALARHQLVLDLGHAEAYAHILAALDDLLCEHDIAYLKWDMNRNHAAGSGADGAAGTHRQTLAVYRLLDELRARHPAVEIESCSSGGGRVDMEILARTDRVWASDCNDALERQVIQRGTSMLLPPELVGAHIGPTSSHTTGRTHSLAFRVATAMFGHLGIEWDITSLTDDERTQLRHGVALHRRFRPLIHSGKVVRFDVAANGATPCGVAHGVVSEHDDEALLCYAQLATGASLVPPTLRLPGFDHKRRYRLAHVPLPGATLEWAGDGAVVRGDTLERFGVQLPMMFPESAMLVHITEAD